MQIDLTNLFLGVIPAFISYLIAINNSKKQIESIRQETERDIQKIKENTKREIDKIEAHTKREIEKIEADTQRQVKIIETQSKSKGNEKITELTYNIFDSVMTNPKGLDLLIELGKIENPTNEDDFKVLKDLNKK